MFIYDFETHSIIDDKYRINGTLSFLIETLQIVVDVNTYKVLTIRGYFPLINVDETKIYILKAANSIGHFIVKNESDNYESGAAVDYRKKNQKYDYYFKRSNIAFDKNNRIIKYGIENDHFSTAKINDNVWITIDDNGAMACIYISIDEFLNES